MNFPDLLELYRHAPLVELMAQAHQIRLVRASHPAPIVTYQIDRNINTTNVCVSGCRFCTFHCRKAQTELRFETSWSQYVEKIDALFALGGDQVLLQGGMHPDWGLEYYEVLFRRLKNQYPTLKLHALGPPEVHFLAKKAKISVEEGLKRLIAAGLDSLPGAGAELLDNEWRRRVSPGKCSADEWIAVMRAAHGLGLLTSATMMYGFEDSPELHIKHLLRLRELQEETGGFRAFIPWPYRGVGERRDGSEYLRVVAISRIVLDNMANIQASWLTVGASVAELALGGGANDLGSVMIEENVVRSAGCLNQIDTVGIEGIIGRAGFSPRLRDQGYNLL